MSDLQIILIILGAFIIAGVVVYNWLQEKKLHKQVSNEFIVPQKDVLAEDFYIDTDAFVEKELADVPHKIKHHAFEDSVNIESKNNVSEKLPTRTEEVVYKNNVLEDTVLEEKPYLKSTFNETRLNEDVAESTRFSDSDESEVEAATNTFSESESSSRLTDSAINQPAKTIHESEETATKVLVEPNEINTAVKSSEIDNTPPQLPNSVHPQIDLTAVLYANKNIGYQALVDMVESIDDISLPIMIYGLDDSDKWHLVDTNNALQIDVNALTFKQVTCSLQLADRGGPAAKNVLNKFQYAVENMGLELNAHVEWQGSGDVLQRAIEIDQFCIEVDQLINIHVAQNEVPIHGTKFRGLAEANGMVLSDDGKFYYQDFSAKYPLFSAIEANHQAFTADSLRNSVLKAITFQLEIPKVPNCEQAFNQMVLIAQKLSMSLTADLVDDNQKPLGDLQVEKIRQQLKIIHATMVARGVMPGSPASMRLFN
ncbi:MULTISPECIES: cell division protein ZipA C-terminal FtsZ-binding domain-containing protein [Methylotenera]|uniref:cell division protein ZipA C-terminal FtsZ-binding domain-containing protein n=1 Tax=Methylotenera TaxID=359407 RepID=UPI0003818051|nr:MULTISPECIES: cell division protein ZipA C-terminal FtsZ-binding domain-containing protein [Methylotenera]